MPNAWVAVDAGIDPLSWARLLRQAYRRTLETPSEPTAPSSIIRPVVAKSWARSERAGVSPRERPPIMLEREEAAQRLRRHRLAPLLPIIETVLVDVARYAHQVVAITDPEGLILWTGGHDETVSAAERAHLSPGALWSESVSGTNAIGTALELDHPVQIFSAEHFKEVLHNWSAAAAPIHDPELGTTLGVVSLSGSFKRAHPHGFSMVATAAHIVEVHLSHAAAQRDEHLKVEYLELVRQEAPDASAVVNPGGRVLLSSPIGWLGSRLRLSPEGVPLAPATEEVTIESMRCGGGFFVRRGANGGEGAARPALRLTALGRDRVEGAVGGRTFKFTPRHGEILVILAHHPEGLDEAELGRALHGEAIKEVTVRAEISRLRKLLGSIVKTQPYRLAADVSADFLELETLLEAQQLSAAAERYEGPLLSCSKAPAVVALRERLDAVLHGALL
jgi:hypothetical protein